MCSGTHFYKIMRGSGSISKRRRTLQREFPDYSEKSFRIAAVQHDRGVHIPDWIRSLEVPKVMNETENLDGMF